MGVITYPCSKSDAASYRRHLTIFCPPPQVLSTNIAETSVTIPDIVYVIDSGKVKEVRLSPGLLMGCCGPNVSVNSLYPPPNKVGGGVYWIHLVIPPPNEVGGGVYWIHLVRLSVCPPVRPSVCRRHGFRSISQVCFGISISNFICMLMVAIGRSLLIFSDVTFKMAAWRPYWIFWFPDSNFTSALNINFKLQRHNTYVYG